MRKHGLQMNPLKCAFCISIGNLLSFLVHKKGIEIDRDKAKAVLKASPLTNLKQLQSLIRKINFLRCFIPNLSAKTKVFALLLKLKREEGFTWTKEHQQSFDKIKECLANPPVMISPMTGRPLKLYILASDSTIGRMLAQENEQGIEEVM